MERLTQWIDENRAIPRVDLRRCGHERCTTQLARYEDTGLAPEQIEELLSRENASEITRSSRDNEVTECCPHCDREITVLWDVEQEGYQIFCPNCGEIIMLCSMCNREPCDWTENGCKYSDDRYCKRKDGRRKYEADT